MQKVVCYASLTGCIGINDFLVTGLIIMKVYCNTSCQAENVNSYTFYHTIFRTPQDSSRAIVGQANRVPSPVLICFNPILMTYSTAWETLGTISKN
jgi:hypothetical protein